VASVWVGFKDQQPLGRNAYGSNVPLPIWIDFMEEALADVPEMPLLQPPGVVTLRVDKATGLPTSVADSTTVSEVFLAEFAPDASSLMSGEQRQTEDIRSVDLF
jgi:penicillin-binding protein 1A